LRADWCRRKPKPPTLAGADGYAAGGPDAAVAALSALRQKAVNRKQNQNKNQKQHKIKTHIH
jgi:hypothetical protein